MKYLLLLTLALPALPATAETRVILERGHVVEGNATVTRIARQFQAIRDVPRVRCPEPVPIFECHGKLDFSSTTETTFRQLYEITVFQEEYGISFDGIPYFDSRPVQRELFGTDLGTEAEAKLEERLLSHVKQLHPLASANPFAALMTGRDPLPYSLLYDDSATPTWICVEQGERRDVTYLEPLPKGGYTVGKGPDEVVDRVCDRLGLSVEPDEADRFDTGIGIRLLRTFRLTVDEAWNPGSDDERAFQPRPASFEKRTLEREEQLPRLGYLRKAGKTIASTLSPKRVHRSVIVEPRAFSPPGGESAVWLARWRGELRDRVFGSEVADKPVEAWELLVAWLPIDDPESEEERPRPPSDGWVEKVQQQLEVTNTITPREVQNAFVRAVGQADDVDGMMLLCSDLKSSYALTPFEFTHKVIDGREGCEAIADLARTRLPDR